MVALNALVCSSPRKLLETIAQVQARLYFSFTVRFVRASSFRHTFIDSSGCERAKLNARFAMRI